VVEFLGQFARRPQVDVEFLHDMNRQPDGPGLVHDGAFDGLANPPGGVGREAETALGVEFLDGPDKPQVAFLDQVEQGQATVDVATGDFHHQAQVAFDHALAAGRITLLRQARKMDFFFRGQQGGKADFVQIQLCRIQRTGVIDVLVLLESCGVLGLGTNRGHHGFIVRLSVQDDAGFHKEHLIVDVKLRRFFVESHLL